MVQRSRWLRITHVSTQLSGSPLYGKSLDNAAGRVPRPVPKRRKKREADGEKELQRAKNGMTRNLRRRARLPAMYYTYVGACGNGRTEWKRYPWLTDSPRGK